MYEVLWPKSSLESVSKEPETQIEATEDESLSGKCPTKIKVGL